MNGKPKRSKQQHSPAELRGFTGLKMKKLLISILLTMSSAVFALPTSPSVTFGAVDPNPPNPTTFNKYDGSVYVKTSDGTDTGDVLQIWHYSIKHNKWVAAAAAPAKKTEFGSVVNNKNKAVVITFATPFTSAPFLVLTPINNGKTSDFSASSPTTTGFTLKRGIMMSAGGLVDIEWKAEEK